MGGSEILERLYEVIESRREERPDGSYVVRLLDGGVREIGAKISEESDEVIEAAAAGDREHTAREVADLLFHTWVMMAHADVRPAQVFDVLEQRFGVGGLVEKASRGETDGG